MAGRRTNLALLGLLALSLATGAVAFGAGTGWGRPVLVAHGVTALAIVALAPWKSAIVRRGLRRRRRGSTASVLLVLLVVVTVVSGVAHSAGLAALPGGQAVLTVHVAAALAAFPVAGWHVAARRIRPRRTDLSRRALLRSAVLLFYAALGYAALEAVARAVSVPGARRRFTGSYEEGSFDPPSMPVTQWLDDSVPLVDPAGWRLVVAGPRGTRAWTVEELSAFADRMPATLDCTGGWYARQEWEGVRMDRQVSDPGGARSVVVSSLTGYRRRFPLRDLPRILIATRVGGAPLSSGHGFPARVVAPGRRGFWWVKWVERVELDRLPWWWQLPFPPT